MSCEDGREIFPQGYVCRPLNFKGLFYCLAIYQEHGVGVVNASPISMGLLSNRGPPSWHPAGESVRNKCKQAADYCQVCYEIN